MCKDYTLKDPRFQAKGTNLTITVTCQDCLTEIKWSSQPKIGQKYAGNILLPASISLT